MQKYFRESQNNSKRPKRINNLKTFHSKYFQYNIFAPDKLYISLCKKTYRSIAILLRYEKGNNDAKIKQNILDIIPKIIPKYVGSNHGHFAGQQL